MCGRLYAKGACAAVATMVLLLPSVVSAEGENGVRQAGPPAPDAAVKERQASEGGSMFRDEALGPSRDIHDLPP